MYLHLLTRFAFGIFKMNVKSIFFNKSLWKRLQNYCWSPFIETRKKYVRVIFHLSPQPAHNVEFLENVMTPNDRIRRECLQRYVPSHPGHIHRRYNHIHCMYSYLCIMYVYLSMYVPVCMYVYEKFLNKYIASNAHQLNWVFFLKNFSSATLKPKQNL
jgi:hypothetical protein